MGNQNQWNALLQELLITQIYIIQYNFIKQNKMIESQRKSVQIYLRIKGPLNKQLKPQFKLLTDDTKIRFKQNKQSQEQQIANDYGEIGVYKFQKIFKEDCHQEVIYDRVAKDLVQSAIEGYNGTIFAYGQTGSGKTFTMTGGDDQPSQMGIIPRVIDDLYRQAETREQEITIKLKYMQIYKKNGYDLLHPDSKTKKLEDLPQVKAFAKGENFQFQNLSEHEAPNFQQAMKIYEYGDTNRIVCKTPSNDQSSRSHCIFMIGVKTKNRDTGLQQKATINLVDLAGSQRIHYSGMQESQAKQGIDINLGLHYLSRVVLSLGQQARGQQTYVPYRDSLLTMALKSSMGGNCKTRMIATINPNPVFNPQNIATCKFSQNLLAMENKLKKNQFINPWDIIKGLKSQVQQLKGQISRLKGESVKQILQREDYIKIHKLVNDFIASQDPASTLPINDRLYIREYLSYMKTIIKLKQSGNSMSMEKNKSVPQISENIIFQMKNLKHQIQQKQNQIQLLLSIINHKRQQNPNDIEDNFIPIQEASTQKIAQAVVKTLIKDKKKRELKLTVQQVEKNLIKPIQLNEEDSVQDAFNKFKDSHLKTEQIQQKNHQINLKQMKKDVILKKIKTLKHRRASVYEKLQQRIKQNTDNERELPSLGVLLNDKTEQINVLKDQLTDLEDKLKKKHSQLRNFQLQIDRLNLCKNKNNQRIKIQFNQYIQDKLNPQKQSSQKSQQTVMKNNKQPTKQNNFKNENKLNLMSNKSLNSTQCDKSQTNSENNEQQQKQIKENKEQVEKQMQQFFKARQQLKKKCAS